MMIDVDVFGGGGGTPTYEIDEKNCYSTAQTYSCQRAFYVVGIKLTDTASQYDQECMGYVENGENHILMNYANRYSISYNNGTLSLQGGYNTSYGWIKIGYM